MMSFWAARFGTTVLYGQSTGVYDHYFRTFLNPTDLLVVPQVDRDGGGHHARAHLLRLHRAGGPAGVGEAVGRAVRTSLIIAAFVLVMISLAVYGQSGNFNLAG